MNRKLHDSALVLTVAALLGALAVLVGPPQRTSAIAVAQDTVQTGVAAPAVAPLRLTAAQTGKSGRARRIRHSVAMPFFSFASRG